MDFVFVSNNLLRTPVANLQGDIYYDIKTTTPSGCLVPVTRIRRLENAPTTAHSKGRRASISAQDHVSDIHWEGLGTPTIIHSHLVKGIKGKGVEARHFLKRRNQFSLSKRCQFFVGNDGVKYRWKIIAGLGCILSRDGKEVARSTRKFITDGPLIGQMKYVLHVRPECSTLDVGLIIISFLVVDHKRLKKESGPLQWDSAHDEDPGDGEGESAEGDNGVEG